MSNPKIMPITGYPEIDVKRINHLQVRMSGIEGVLFVLVHLRIDAWLLLDVGPSNAFLEIFHMIRKTSQVLHLENQRSLLWAVS